MATNLIQQQSSMSSPLVWFLLLDSATGLPYRGTSATKVSVKASADLDDFRDAVKAKHFNKLSSFDAADLNVYKNKAAFDNRNAPVDEDKEEPLEEDSLLYGLGTSKKEALIVVVPSSTFGGDEMEVDSSLTTFDSSLAFTNLRIDGIAIGTEHLKRNELVGKLQALVSKQSIVLLSSPAGSGKSSLYSLYKAATKNLTVLGISFLDERTPSALLLESGIDFTKKKISENLAKKNVVFFLDDAQNKYNDLKFWNSLVKATGIWIPKNIKFIVSATHSLSGGKESPVEFVSLPRLSRMDFLLSDEEAYQLLEFPDTGLPENIRQHQVLKDVLVKECGGLVAALRLSINTLESEFFISKKKNIDETLCLQFCYSDQFIRSMARCFGSAHAYPIGNDFKVFLKRCFENKMDQENGFTDQQDNESYSSLKKAGILVELPGSSFGFSSPLAKRYYFKWIFPNRSLTVPSSLRELIGKVISNMSSTVLKNSTRPGDFPKEAVFQHLFMEGLALYTPSNCSICPELSKIFSPRTYVNSQQAIAGEIDFYLYGSLRWGIELLVNGDGIGEHISRFTPPNGKYVALAVNDYAIVDFRRNATGNISKHPNRIFVFFKNDDYSVAKCLFGEDIGAIEINLAD